jgi:cytochrome c
MFKVGFMDSFEWNKIFAGILISLIVAMVGSLVADALIAPKKLEKNIFVVDVPTENMSTEAEKPLDPITPLLASADVAAGEVVFKKCLQCHTPNKGEPNKTGPNMWNIVGSKFAHRGDFAYSEGLKSEHDKKNWGFEELNIFLHKPRDYIKGTKMSFVGLKDDKDRANVIAYLNTLNDRPKPLK